MSTPQLNIVPAEAAASPVPHAATQREAMGLSFPAGAQVHIHLGAAPVAAVQPVAAYRRGLVPLVLAGLVLFGGGYLAGSRGTTIRAGDDGPSALAYSSLPPAPALPPAPGEIPPALRAQLARPPVVTPPPGAVAAPGGAGAPVRNPFGLGN